MKTVLLLGDITGRSRVALRMLSRVLEDRGREVLMLPTALISNTLNLGRHEALDTTDYLLRSLETWNTLGLACDLAYIGYITGMEQAEKLCAVADRLREKGVPVVLDPILGDNGRRYNSVSDGQLEGMKMLCRHADLITPNMTEASLLLGDAYDAKCGAAYAQRLAQMGCSVLVTSCQTQESRPSMTGYDRESGKAFEIPFDRVPGHHWGTGDLFTGLMIDALLHGKGLDQAAGEAGEHVARQLRGEEKSLLPEQ
ncbi:MAG: bifunctional hydroxymethylpyrimidine kinase/phosphomethylpyrimidine kinase [Clostridia bacterium]|nr:bifunctional hydroxymethylpyrimidine kinase/phosphomethylpyrimidine kinase [Clostridia bacterium]